ncbi:MAG: type II toxin-antitoxin system prevent-host-death family antitoxin [Hyphomicrobiaceae bacterium]|nr:type II toxin-antitoxin system prevent-host-death family antitoxin [Hyphomicrobiaceae bacterium]
MIETVPIEELGDRVAEVIDRVESGETVVVTRQGKPVLDLVPHRSKAGVDVEAGRRFLVERGLSKTVSAISDDFDDPLPEDVLVTPLPDRGRGLE